MVCRRIAGPVCCSRSLHCRHDKLQACRIAAAFAVAVSQTLRADKVGRLLLTDRFADQNGDRLAIGQLLSGDC